MALVDFYPSMQPSAAEVQNGKFFTLPIRPTKITQILSVLTHFISLLQLLVQLRPGVQLLSVKVDADVQVIVGVEVRVVLGVEVDVDAKVEIVHPNPRQVSHCRQTITPCSVL